MRTTVPVRNPESQLPVTARHLRSLAPAMLRTTLRKSIPPRRLLTLPNHVRTYATPAGSTHALVFIEHRDGDLDSGSLSALTAASQLGGKVTGLVVGGEGVGGVVEKARKWVHIVLSWMWRLDVESI